MERLIRRRLISCAKLTELLADFNGEPAIFYHSSPDDTAWGQSQYPRLVLEVETFASAERGVAGALTIEVICSETFAAVESIEMPCRRSLEGVFFTPQRGETFAVKWRDTSLIKEQITSETLVNGALINFDIYEYPALKTADPDPLAALNHFAKHFEPALKVIGFDELDEVYVPSRQSPAIYFSRRTLRGTDQKTGAVFIDGQIAAHIFAPSIHDRTAWLVELQYELLLRGEVTLLDGSPMFIESVAHDATADEIRGQLTIDCRYGLLRKKPYAHKLLTLAKKFHWFERSSDFATQ